MVPVLSNTTSVISLAFSIGLGDRIIKPHLAPLPAATISAIGVASPNAHGQAMINTAIAVAIDLANSAVVKYQVKKVAIDKTSTIGTKKAET